MSNQEPPPATPGLPPRAPGITVEQMLQRLTLLQPLAAKNRGPVPAGDPRRVAGEEYAWLIHHARTSGATTSQLVDATGTPWPGLRSRLARHGYSTTPPSMSPYQGPIERTPEPTCQKGHPFNEENTYSYTGLDGEHRVCRQCRRERMARRRAAEKARAGTKAAPQSRLRHDQQNLSTPTLTGSASGRRWLNLTETLELYEQLTGRRIAAGTLRSYLSRGRMPAPGPDGLFDEKELRNWIQGRRPTADPAVVRRTQARIATLKTPAARARAVQQARAAQVSWAAIGEALGMTRQQAWRRYSSGTSSLRQQHWASHGRPHVL